MGIRNGGLEVKTSKKNLVFPPFLKKVEVTLKMICGKLLVTLAGFLSIIPNSYGNLAAKRYKSTCETNPSDIHLTKDEYDSGTGIILRTCYDTDGNRLSGTQGSMSVQIREPMDCKC